MIPQEIRQAIIARGATRAVVWFSGGNDEGGATNASLYNGETEVTGKLDLADGWYGLEYDPVKKIHVERAATDKLAAYLNDLPDSKYDGFGGEFYVSGTITVDVPTGKVTWAVNESHPVTSHREWES